MEHFLCKTKIVSGSGTIGYLKELKCKRLFLIADPFFMENGIARQVAEASGAAQVQMFGEVQPDPTVELAAKATAAVREFQPDTVVALGGGSAMDCAKAMCYFSGLDMQFVAIPTTSGSGSEVTDFAILTHNGVKHPLVDSRLRPNVAILDSDLLKNLPAGLIADSGFDVLAHAVEAYVAKDASGITDALAADAFRVVFAALPQSFAGMVSVREKIHMASTMAGMAFTQAGLGLCHAMSHALGGQFHIPHGRLNAILLPAVIACNAHCVGDKYARLARSAGISGAADTVAVRNLKNALIRLRRELKLPDSLAQCGIDPGEVYFRRKEIVSATLQDPCCSTNPLPVEDFMVCRILEEVAGRV